MKVIEMPDGKTITLVCEDWLRLSKHVCLYQSYGMFFILFVCVYLLCMS